MGAGKQNGIDGRVLRKQLIKILFDEIIHPTPIVFIILHQWHPHRAGMLHHLYFRGKFFYFNRI